jgi:hypothetical protein
VKVVLASAFRDATPYLGRYADQVIALNDALHSQGHKLHCLWGEGDSTDHTLTALRALRWRLNSQVIDVTHGGKKYGSIVNDRRFQQLAHVGNTLWAALPGDADAVIWVESDLIWEPATLLALVDHTAVYPCVAPMILDRLPDTGAQANATFYDVYAYRRRGIAFTKAPPYHPDLPAVTRMVRMDSVGSCLAMRGRVAHGLYFPVNDVIVGLCAQIREKGESVWLDKTLTVWHP